MFNLSLKTVKMGILVNLKTLQQMYFKKEHLTKLSLCVDVSSPKQICSFWKVPKHMMQAYCLITICMTLQCWLAWCLSSHCLLGKFLRHLLQPFVTAFSMFAVLGYRLQIQQVNYSFMTSTSNQVHFFLGAFWKI